MLGAIGLVMAIFGDKAKRRDRFIGFGIACVAWLVLIIIIGVSASSGSGKKPANVVTVPATASAASTTAPANTEATTGPAKAAATATLVPLPTTPPVKYKLRVTKLDCTTDAIGDRVCSGTVTNIQPVGKNATDISPVIHWTGGTESDYGDVAINPLLPGQSSTFTAYTLHPNPVLQEYTIGFKKVFGDESDYPVDPVPAE